jgi:hypothetical protein
LLAGLGFLLAACAAAHLYLLNATYGSTFDLTSYSQQAFAVTHRLNVYDYTIQYPYPPVWIWIVGAVAKLAPVVSLPFHVAIKVPATLADLAIVVLLFEYVRARRGWVVWTLVPAALYALNPVPALISAAHGQFDSLPVLFMLLALHLHDRGRMGSLDLAALSLGVAIALKAYPALLLPYFALTAPPGKKVRTFGIALVPTALAAAIYVLAVGYSPAMLTHVIGYTSTAAIGWRMLLLDPKVPLELVVVAWLGSILLILVFATLVPWLVFGRRSMLAAASTFGFFFTVIFRASVQYLVWGLPFFCLVAPIATIVYSASATAMLLSFYATEDPLILPENVPTSVLGLLQSVYGLCVALVIASSALMLATTLVKNRAAIRTLTTPPIGNQLGSVPVD